MQISCKVSLYGQQDAARRLRRAVIGRVTLSVGEEPIRWDHYGLDVSSGHAELQLQVVFVVDESYLRRGLYFRFRVDDVIGSPFQLFQFGRKVLLVDEQLPDGLFFSIVPGLVADFQIAGRVTLNCRSSSSFYLLFTYTIIIDILLGYSEVYW